MADRPIPARSEVPEESTWNLKDVFESDEAWQAEYEALKAVPEQIEAFRGRLGESAETLLEWFRLNDALSVRLEKLYGYASCKGDEDTGNGFYQGMRSKALATLVAIDAASAFETPEIMALDEDTVNLFYAAQPELETYRRNIYKIRRRIVDQTVHPQPFCHFFPFHSCQQMFFSHMVQREYYAFTSLVFLLPDTLDQLLMPSVKPVKFSHCNCRVTFHIEPVRPLHIFHRFLLYLSHCFRHKTF